MKRTELRRTAPMRRTRPPNRPKAPKRKVRPVADMKNNRPFWEEQRTILAFRAGFRCERCGCDLNVSGLEAHHRKLRSQGGGHDIRNLVALCPDCHTGPAGVHSRVAEARLAGFIVPSAADPFIRPVTLHDGRVVLLTEGGGYELVFPDPEGEAT